MRHGVMIPTDALADTEAVFRPFAVARLLTSPPLADWDTVALSAMTTLPLIGSR